MASEKKGERPTRQKSSPEAAGSLKRFQSAESQRRYSRQMREAGRKIGFVPTMGAFHEGHLSLMRRARSQNDIVVVSIFVNPMQFAPGEDYQHYPRELARDIDQAREVGVDAVFAPEVSEIYPEGFTTRITVGPLAEKLCGAARPGHFDGVCTVVAKLLGIVQPHRLYLGAKDAQQSIILQRMITDLDMDVKVVSGPTVREPDGLAMSSRNSYLTPPERAEAPRIYAALRMAQREILIGHERDAARLRARMQEWITKDSSIEPEYVALVDPETLAERPVLTSRTLILVAARLGQARLIDNLMVHVPGGRMAEKVEMTGKTA